MDASQLSITTKSRIFKYADGADPKKDEPIEVVENEFMLHGQDAVDFLNQHGVSTEEALKMAQAAKSKDEVN